MTNKEYYFAVRCFIKIHKRCILAIISLKTINTLSFLFGLYSSIFLSSISLDYSLKTLKSFKCLRPVLSLSLTSNWCFVSYGL